MRGAIVVCLGVAACSSSSTLPAPGEGPDASMRTAFVDAGHGALHDASGAADAGPLFNGGGPLACGGCTCDGTLYGCLQNATSDGGCPQGGGPPIPPDHAPLDDGAAPDASACDAVCKQLAIQCLPNPTCACLGQAMGLECAVDPSGNGFVLTCPPPPP